MNRYFFDPKIPLCFYALVALIFGIGMVPQMPDPPKQAGTTYHCNGDIVDLKQNDSDGKKMYLCR